MEAQTYVQASPCPQVFPPDKEQSGLRVAPGGAGPGGGAWCLSQAVSWSQEACGQHWTRFSNVTQGPAHVPCREGACRRGHTRACVLLTPCAPERHTQHHLQAQGPGRPKGCKPLPTTAQATMPRPRGTASSEQPQPR